MTYSNKQIRYFIKGFLSALRFIKPIKPRVNHSSRNKMISGYFAKVEEYFNIANDKINTLDNQ